LSGERIARCLFVRRDRAADHGEGIVDLLAAVGAVIDGDLEQGLALARGRDDAADVLGGEQQFGLEGQALLRRLGQADGDAVRGPFRLAVDRIAQFLIEVILGMEAQPTARAVLPRGRAQIAHRHLAFAAVELRNLAELERIAFAGVAGEVVQNAPAHGFHRLFAARCGKLEIVDGAMRGKRDRAVAGRSGLALGRLELRKGGPSRGRNNDRNGTGARDHRHSPPHAPWQK